MAGGDAFLGVQVQLSEVEAVAEHHVADNDQAPMVAKDFQAEIDRTSRSLIYPHAPHLLKPIAI
jgi:hypothetical protein